MFLFLFHWESDLRTHLYNLSQRIFCLYSFISFMVSYLIFQSLSHFEFISVHGLRVCSNFIDLHVAFQLSQHHLLKRLFFFPIVYSCLFCQRLTDHRCVDLFLGSLFCSINPYVCFCANIMLFWLLYLCSIVWSLGRLYLYLCSFFSIALAILWKFHG